jgi:hypothetical protein
VPNPFTITWEQNGSILHGYGLVETSPPAEEYIEGSLIFPISFPSVTTNPIQVTLKSSALANGTFDILSNVRFYLSGDPDDLNIVQNIWPNLDFSFSPPLPELSGGLQISFDGVNWTTFSIAQPDVAGSVGVGDINDSTTWLLLPALAIGPNGSDGVLGPFDVATIYLRYVIPPGATQYQVFDVSLSIDCDVV